MAETIHIKLFPREQEIIETMRDRGYPVNEVIRELIRNYGKSEFPEEKGYSKAAFLRAKIAVKDKLTQEEKDAMTNEEYAEKELKAVVKNGMAYITLFNTSVYGFPLETIKEIGKDEPMIQRHLVILANGEVRNNQGQLMSEADKAEARANLEKLRGSAEVPTGEVEGQ